MNKTIVVHSVISGKKVIYNANLIKSIKVVYYKYEGMAQTMLQVSFVQGEPDEYILMELGHRAYSKGVLEAAVTRFMEEILIKLVEDKKVTHILAGDFEKILIDISI